MANSNFDSEPGSSGSQPMQSEILDLAPFQVALLDPQLRFKYVNPCFAQFHGYSRDSLLLKTLPETSKAFYEKIQPFLNESLSGKKVTCAIQLPDAQQKPRWLDIKLIPDVDRQEKINGIYCFVADVTESKESERLQAAEEVKRRDEFLAMLSHELRNPLAAITFSLDWLQATEDKTLDEKSEKLLEVISRQADHMSKLLQDLLDVTRVTQNRIDYHFVVHDLNQSIRDVVDSILPAITGKYQHLIVNLATEPLMVKGDVIRLKQALANLLDNASKYTPEHGQIWLQTEKINGQAAFSVRDSGFGIAKEALNSIFELFFQAGQPMQRKTGGIGVGLYLVDQIVHAHEGSIAATSDGPGQGSKFTICLPITDDQGNR